LFVAGEGNDDDEDDEDEKEEEGELLQGVEGDDDGIDAQSSSSLLN
jgi:hypothetical protein